MIQQKFIHQQFVNRLNLLLPDVGDDTHDFSETSFPDQKNEDLLGEPSEGREIPDGANTKGTLHSVTILLADDDSDDRELFKEAMEDRMPNLNLEFAIDGKNLMDKLHHTNHLPDVLFLDLNMPYKSGFECLAEIRKTERLKDIPVIIYSTSSSQKDIDETFQKGANLYVKKPSYYKELQDMVSCVLKLDWNICKPNASRHQFFFNTKML